MTLFFRALIQIGTVTLLAASAQAYEKIAFGACPHGVFFAQPPHVVLHTDTMTGFSDAEIDAVVADMQAIHQEIGSLGGTGIQIRSFTVTVQPWSWKSWSFNAEPTIHIGFTPAETTLTPLGGPQPSFGIEVAPAAATHRLAPGTCSIAEAHIYFQDQVDVTGNPLMTWAEGEPDDYGIPYNDAQLDDVFGRFWRSTYLHELLHALGLDHSDSTYAMTNYGDRPWANRDPGQKLKPLPDDIRGLRELYPAPEEINVDVAVLNTFVNFDDVSDNGTPRQGRLCQPSTGARFAPDFSEALGVDPVTGAIDPIDRCGENEVGNAGDVLVCPGDTVFTRYSVANYGTETVTLRSQMWMSEDDVWDGRAGGDVKSPDVKEFGLSGGFSTKRNSTFEVPEGVAYDTTYDVLIRVKVVNDVSHVPGADKDDWIPMRGTVRTKPFFDCVEGEAESDGVSDGISFGRSF